MGERKIPTSPSHSTTTSSSNSPTQATSSLSIILQQISLQHLSPMSPTLLRSTPTPLTRLRTLHPSSHLLLFTPVIPPPLPPHSPSTPRTDPFEPLGRALAQYHTRIRHVPYVPSVGMTDTHIAFLRHAGAVVVVACDIDGVGASGGSKINGMVDGKGTATGMGYDYDAQRAFAANVTQVARESEELGDVPVVLLVVDRGEERSDFKSAFEVVFWTGGYGPQALSEVAGAMLGGGE